MNDTKTQPPVAECKHLHLHKPPLLQSHFVAELRYGVPRCKRQEKRQRPGGNASFRVVALHPVYTIIFLYCKLVFPLKINKYNTLNGIC